MAATLYPLADRNADGWYADGDYLQRGGTMTWMAPAEFLSKVRPLEIDEVSRDNIDDLKDHIASGRRLDPLRMGDPGREDGRHRAHACRELGIALVPVLEIP